MLQGKLANQHMMAALGLRPKTMSGAVKIASQIATAQWAAEQLQAQDESSVFSDFEIKQ